MQGVIEMLERHRRVLTRAFVAAAGVIAVFLIGAGILLLWNPALILKVLIYGFATGCLLLGAVTLISLLTAAFGGLTQ